jgi:hypothetical protein
MNVQVICMTAICVLCEISALDWLRQGVYSDAVAFAAFGCGYLGLAWAFWSVS